jgi:hypothetical protein
MWRRLFRHHECIALGEMEIDLTDKPDNASSGTESEWKRKQEEVMEKEEIAVRQSADERDRARIERRASCISELKLQL